ncbi:MAG: AAA family ATPase [Phycisphaerales bacterium]|nr:AAA family ATPase [Phycisphaerales bacterium]
MTTRILVFGNAGAGKTTLARQLASEHHAERLDLDTIAWKPVGSTNRRPLDEVRTHLAHFMAQHANWVIEGCYGDIIELVMSHATAVYFLDIDPESCIERNREREWEPHKFRSPEDQTQAQTFLESWIREYHDRTDEFGHAWHRRLFETFTREKHLITE